MKTLMKFSLAILVCLSAISCTEEVTVIVRNSDGSPYLGAQVRITSDDLSAIGQYKKAIEERDEQNEMKKHWWDKNQRAIRLDEAINGTNFDRPLTDWFRGFLPFFETHGDGIMRLGRLLTEEEKEHLGITQTLQQELAEAEEYVKGIYGER
jgi:hypothetical protein